MYLPPDASAEDARAHARLLDELERRQQPPGSKKNLESYASAARHPTLVQAARQALTHDDAGKVASHPLFFAMLGIVASEGSDASVEVMRTVVGKTLAAVEQHAASDTSLGAKKRVELLSWLGQYRGVLSGVPGEAAATTCRQVRAAWRKLFASSLAAQVLEAAGVEAPDESDWSATLTHVAPEGYAQVVASSGGDLHAVFAEGTTRYVLIDRDGPCALPDFPVMSDVRDLRAHLERCVAARGFAPWEWGKLHDPDHGPHGSVVRIFGMKSRAKKGLEAWWLGGEPVGGRPIKKPAPLSRFEAFVPTGTSEAERKPLRVAFRILDNADMRPCRPQHFDRIRQLATNEQLVRTLMAWLKASEALDGEGATPTPDLAVGVADFGVDYALGILAASGSPAALEVVQRSVEEELALGIEPPQLWGHLRLLQELRPEHPLVRVLRHEWLERFSQTPGGRLLQSMGVALPCDADWEVVLMLRQDRGDAIIEIYPSGFFVAEARVADERNARGLIPRDPPAQIEQIREHFDACARQARLDPWNPAAEWKPLETPNGGVVQLKGFARSDAQKITSWFRGWKSER